MIRLNNPFHRGYYHPLKERLIKSPKRVKVFTFTCLNVGRVPEIPSQKNAAYVEKVGIPCTWRQQL
jgi:hypothetical protein